ncbi:MAG: hypothetical protein ACOYXA_09040 [Bacteroidota bacterium]
MKKILLSILVLACLSAKAQRLVIGTGVERTVAGTEVTAALGYQNAKQWGLGGFYQQDMVLPRLENNKNLPASSWYGVFANVPLAKSEKITYSAQLRVGLAEQKYIQVVPSLETKIKITPWMAAGTGCSYRQGYAAFMVRTYFHFINR